MRYLFEMKKKMLLIPKLRFPDYINQKEWDTKSMDTIFNIRNGYTPSKANPRFWDNGNIPWFRMEDIRLNGHILSDSIQHVTPEAIKGTGLFPAYSIIVATTATIGEHALIIVDSLANQQFTFLTKRKSFEKVIDMLYFHYYMFIVDDWCKKNTNCGGLLSVNMSAFKHLMIPYPIKLSEQRKIAECLSTIDSYISSINEKVEQLKAHKKSLLQKLFPQRGQTIPEYRFSEFQKDSAWKKMKLGDVTTVINRRNKSNRSLPIYSISNKDGFVLQSEQFDGLDSESRGYDISLYKIVGRNTFAYNPARINIGSIGYSGDLKEVLISSLYVCFKTTDELDDEFLICFLKTAQFNQAVENNVEGGIRSYLFYENFSRINISLPSLQEQKKIASTILSIDDVISKYANKVSLLNDYKKGLMQQLFPTITK